MQEINAEYDELRKRVGNVHETADGKRYEKERTAETVNAPEVFKKIIEQANKAEHRPRALRLLAVGVERLRGQRRIEKT